MLPISLQVADHQLVEKLVPRAEHMCQVLGRHAQSGEQLDVQHEFQKLTFDVIGELCLGTDFKSQTEEQSPYAKVIIVV
jgi:cytochrome P450